MKSTNAMELEGLKRGLQFLDDLMIGEHITDRHIQVKKYMKDEHTDKQHYFDVWHVAIGMLVYDITPLSRSLLSYFQQKLINKILQPFLGKAYLMFTCNSILKMLKYRHLSLFLGVPKKLEQAAKKKECQPIRPWIKSTVNHMYWIAATCGDRRRTEESKVAFNC